MDISAVLNILTVVTINLPGGSAEMKFKYALIAIVLVAISNAAFAEPAMRSDRMKLYFVSVSHTTANVTVRINDYPIYDGQDIGGINYYPIGEWVRSGENLLEFATETKDSKAEVTVKLLEGETVPSATVVKEFKLNKSASGRFLFSSSTAGSVFWSQAEKMTLNASLKKEAYAILQDLYKAVKDGDRVTFLKINKLSLQEMAKAVAMDEESFLEMMGIDDMFGHPEKWKTAKIAPIEDVLFELSLSDKLLPVRPKSGEYIVNGDGVFLTNPKFALIGGKLTIIFHST